MAMKRRTPLLLNALLGILPILTLVAVFWGISTPKNTLFSVDGPPLFPGSEGFKDMLSMYTGHWRTDGFATGEAMPSVTFTPISFICNSMLNPLFGSQIAQYVLASLLTFWGAVYYLRFHRVEWAAACIAALGLAFTGYSFTLVSAGHIGFFHLMYCVVFLFACLDRAITKGSMVHYALVAACIIWSAASQPDITLPAVLLGVVYGLFILVRRIRQRPDGTTLFHSLRPVLIGLVITLLSGLVLGSGLLRSATGVVAMRDSAIQDSNETPWQFRTNWSFPPGESIEFIAPNIFGVEPIKREAPYWGALGRRPYNWAEMYDGVRGQIRMLENPNQRQQLIEARGLTEAQINQNLAQLKQNERALQSQKNFRQHSVYLGVIQVSFALYAMFWAVRSLWPVRSYSPAEPAPATTKEPAKGKKRKKQSKKKTRTTTTTTRKRERPLLTLEEWHRPVIFFWSCVALFSLLLAFGRNSPVYKLWYLLPVIKDIRAPVKYIRFLEIALCFLSGCGLSILIQQARTKITSSGFRNAFYIAGGTFAVLFLFALLGLALYPGSESMRAELSFLGLSSITTNLVAQARSALLHPVLLFLLIAGLFIALGFFRKHTGVLIGALAAIALAVAVDMASVAKNFVNTRDMTAFYEANTVADKMIELAPHSRLSPQSIPNNRLDPLRFTFWHHGVDVAGSSPLVASSYCIPFQKHFSQPGKRALLDQLTSTRFKILPRAQWLREKGLDPTIAEIGGIAIDQKNRSMALLPSGGGQFLLAEKQNALPRAAVFHQWQSTQSTNAWALVERAGFDPANQIVLGSSSSPITAPAGNLPRAPAQIVEKWKNGMRLSATTTAPGILVVTDSFHPQLKATVDGKPAEVLSVNGLVRGVHLPEAGEHEVTFQFAPYKLNFLLSVVGTLLLLAWCAVSLLRRPSGQKEETVSEEDPPTTA